MERTFPGEKSIAALSEESSSPAACEALTALEEKPIVVAKISAKKIIRVLNDRKKTYLFVCKS